APSTASPRAAPSPKECRVGEERPDGPAQKAARAGASPGARTAGPAGRVPAPPSFVPTLKLAFPCSSRSPGSTLSQRGRAATRRKRAAGLNLVGPRRNGALVVQNR